MSRTDRLYALMQRLKDGHLHTAEDLAAALQVSVRTIYRDMETLAASGVPIEGERGRGYTARAALVSEADIAPYDHLSRFGEWDVIDAAVKEPLT